MAEDSKLTIKELFRAPPRIGLDIANAESVPLVLFTIENHLLSLETSVVREIVENLPIRKISCSNAMALGVISYGGEIVPIFNLARMYSGSTPQDSNQLRIAILEIENQWFGIVVDEVFYASDYQFSAAGADSPDQDQYQHQQEFVEARGRLFMLLDPATLLATITRAAN
jgi:chemotaxis signal transduction protein